jgi:hypothetical protein
VLMKVVDDGEVTASAKKLHLRVVDDVLKNIRAEWLEGGVELATVDALRDMWLTRLQASSEAKNAVKKEPGLVSKAELLLFGDDNAPVSEEENKKRVSAPPPDDQRDEKKLKRVESQKEVGEESLSSLTDSSDEEEGDVEGEATNLLLCQFETVKKTKNQWKVKMRSGLLMTPTQDYRFTTANATLTRW